MTPLERTSVKFHPKILLREYSGSSVNDTIQEKDLVMLVLSKLPQEYHNLVTTLETLEEEKLTWDYIRDRLLAEYERKVSIKQQQKHKNPHDALYVGGGSQGGGGNDFQENLTVNLSLSATIAKK